MANARIGALRVDLGLNSAAFEKGLSASERRLNKFSKRMGKLGDQLTGIGNKLSIGLTLPLAAFGATAFKAAMDAEEMESAFNVVFGNMAEDVRAWAEETGNAMGRSTQEIQRGALAFQELFGKALEPAKAAEMSKQFAVLTQDLASFKNLSNEVAQQKLFSGLSGEAEPLRAVGVFINAAAVEAKALELGLEGVNGKLTDQEKIVARAALIQEQLSDAQGDVLRTSDSTANQIRKAQAAFEELQITVGTKLLPVLTPLIEKLAAALEWLTNLPAPVQDASLVIGGLAAALGPVLSAVGSIISIAGPVAKAFGLIKIAALALMANPVILAFAGVIAGIYLVWQNWDKIAPILRRLYEGAKTWLLDKLGAIFNWVGKKIEQVKGFFSDLYTAVVGNSYIPDMVNGIAAEMSRLEAVMVSPAEKAARDTKEVMRDMALEVSSLLDRLFRDVAQARQKAAEIALLRKAEKDGLISAPTRQEAVRRVQGFNEGPLAEAEKVKAATVEVSDAMKKLGDKNEIQTVRIAQTFEDMTQNIMSSIRSLVDGIKSGDILSVFDGILSIFTQLGSAGVFGSKIQGNLNKTVFGGARAMGGPVSAGKAYLVGERGPELFTPNVSGRITANDNLGSRTEVQIVPSPYFDVRVDGRIAATAPAIANAGSALAQGEMAQRARRRVR